MSLQNRRTFHKNNLIRRQATKPRNNSLNPDLKVCKINLFNNSNIEKLLLYVVSLSMILYIIFDSFNNVILETADEAYNYFDASMKIKFEQIRWNLAIKDYTSENGNFGPFNSKPEQCEKLFTHMKEKNLFNKSSVEKLLRFYNSSGM
jgi:hypothetical protein